VKRASDVKPLRLAVAPLRAPWIAALSCAIVILVLPIIARMVTGPPGALVHVRWQTSIDASARQMLEARFRLADGEQLDGSTWRYDLLDPSRENIRDLVSDPAVADTQKIDRAHFTPIDTIRTARRGRIGYGGILVSSADWAAWAVPVITCFLVLLHWNRTLSIAADARLWPTLLAASGYLLITALLFRSVLPRLPTHLFGDLGDPLLNTSILAWNAKHLPLSNGWWNFPAFAPLSGITAFTEHLLGAYPLTSPIIWFTANAALAYNALQLVTLPLNGLATFALVRELTGSWMGGFIGGLAFAFAPFTGAHSLHVQMLMAFGMPVALYGLHRYVKNGAARDLIWFGLGLFSALLSNAYTLVFFPILVVLWVLFFLKHADTRRWIAIAAAAGAAFVLVVPLLIGYHIRQTAYGLVRDDREIASWSAGVQSLAGVNPQSVLWAGWLPDTPGYEQSLFPGFAIIALAAVGVGVSIVSQASREWRRVALFYLAGAFIMWAFALGPEVRWFDVRIPLRYTPYSLLLALPGSHSIRVPSRAWLLATLCLAVCAGLGAAWLASRRHAKWLIAPLATLMIAEGWFVGPVVQVPTSLPLRVPPGALVLDLLRMINDDGRADPQYLAVVDNYRVMNGYSGYAPRHLDALRQALADHRLEAFTPFRKRSDVYVVARPGVEPQFVTWLDSLHDAERLIDSGQLKVYRLPRVESEPPPPVLLPLPKAGEPTLTIDVH
jgi:hypothetical protein